MASKDEYKSEYSEELTNFIETPAAPPTAPESTQFGVRSTAYPAIKNAPLPADAAGSESFNNYVLFALLGGIPGYMAYKIGGGLKTW
ncbi:hypothetical protein KCV02_g24878, partial [Aureobasidium melanogenum]